MGASQSNKSARRRLSARPVLERRGDGAVPPPPVRVRELGKPEDDPAAGFMAAPSKGLRKSRGKRRSKARATANDSQLVPFYDTPPPDVERTYEFNPPEIKADPRQEVLREVEHDPTASARDVMHARIRSRRFDLNMHLDDDNDGDDDDDEDNEFRE